MKQFLNGIMVFVFIAAVTGSGSVVAQMPQPSNHATFTVNAPETLVRSLYKLHAKGQGPVFGKGGRKYLDRYFDAKLSGLLWKNIVGPPNGDVGNLDFDPLFNAQDLGLSELHIAPLEKQKSTANPIVVVTFKNYGQQNRIFFHLHRFDGAWKIQDIDYGAGVRLVKILSQPF